MQDNAHNELQAMEYDREPHATLTGNDDTEFYKATLTRRLEDPRGMYRHFPPPLEARYRQQHLALTLQLQRSFWPWVLLTVCTFCAAAILMAGDQRAIIFTLNGVIVTAGLFHWSVLFLGRLSHLIHSANGLAAAVALLALHIASTALPDGSLHKSVSEYAIILVSIATFTIARLPLRQACLWVGLSVLLAPLLNLVLSHQTDWQRFVFFAPGATLIGFLLGFIQEARERTVFAQEFLLKQEKSQLQQLSSDLARMSHHDNLTGLPNRRHFDEMLALHWKTAQREGQVVNLMFMDVDDFKAFNDHYGHQAGDACLTQVASAIRQQALRASDFVARYGGEEFVALFPGTSRKGLETIATRMIEAVDLLAIPHARGRAAEHVTLSVGIASLQPDQHNSAEILLKLADEALYKAKGTGRHRFVFSAPQDMTANSQQD